MDAGAASHGARILLVHGARGKEDTPGVAYPGALFCKRNLQGRTLYKYPYSEVTYGSSV
jgi:hypothetical protein